MRRMDYAVRAGIQRGKYRAGGLPPERAGVYLLIFLVVYGLYGELGMHTSGQSHQFLHTMNSD